MPIKKITDLTDIGTPASDDLLEIVDVSDTTDSPEGTSKKVLVSALGGGGGVTEFTELTDVPASYTGQASKVVAVKVDETGLEFVAGGGGTTPTLQEVTDEGNTTTNPIILGDSTDSTILGGGVVSARLDDTAVSGEIHQTNLNSVGEITYSREDLSTASILRFSEPTIGANLTLPDADGMIALLSDITNPPDATPTVKGIAKLYTSLGSNTDGAVDQNTVDSALALKANAPLVDTVSSSALTGVTTEGILKSYLIEAGTYSASEILNFANDLYKTGTAGTVTSRLYTNTTNSLSGASLLAVNISTSGSRKIALRRQLVLKDGNIETLATTATVPDDNVNSGTVATIVTFNPAVDNYFITTAQNASTGDSTIQNNFKIHF